jgi:alcohol dehydrogenase class IV
VTVQFEHESHAQRVVFTSGGAAAALGAEVDRFGGRRVMVIADEETSAMAERISAGLPVAVRHSEVAMHVPAPVADRARAVAAEHDVDLLVSVGGGSTTGLAKAIALTSGLPIVAVPTTYAGSEATWVWGITDSGAKTTGRDVTVLPRSVVYDATLTMSLPVEMSVASGLNAVAHGVDSMWSPDSDPIDRALAEEAIRSLALGLPRVVDDPGDLSGREQVLYGAYLAAVAFSCAGSGLHHKICHVLGGRYDLPHAQTHAVVLPYVLAVNAPYCEEADVRVARAFGAATALEGLQALRERVRAPRALRDHGFAEDDIADAARAVAAVVPEDNPAPLSVDDLERLLRAAWAGTESR